MKRYLVFNFDQYYPRGGWKDFVGSADTIDEAHTAYHLTQIVDSQTGKCVYGEDAEGH